MAKPPADTTIRRVVAHLTDSGGLDQHHLHADTDCEGLADTVETELAAVIGALHRQAHPGESRHVIGCRLEPCRSIPLTAYPAVAID